MHVLKPTIDETGLIPSNCLIQFSLNRVLNNAIATFALGKLSDFLSCSEFLNQLSFSQF